jgi:nucleotide-binding universal stress UspA family protein
VLASEESALAEVLPRRGEPMTTRAQRATVESLLESTAQALRRRGLEVEAESVTNDAPADGIVDYAVENGIDLIAMTTRSKGGLERWFLGSVADKVLRGPRGPCSCSTPRPPMLLARDEPVIPPARSWPRPAQPRCRG